jgi:hypothetical protein
MHRTDLEHEYLVWRDLVALLKECGAVTAADCRAPIDAALLTPGLRLFDAIRVWGRAYARCINAERS